MTLGIHHLAVNAVDPAGLARLYAEGAGFVPRAGGRWVAAPNLFLSLHQAAGSIGQAEHDRRVCDPGLTHFCIQSGDSEGLWRSLDGAGLRFNAAPAALGTGATYAYGRDPECNVIEAESVGDVAPGTPPWFAHVALCTADLDRLVDFYEALVGRAAHHRGTYANPLFEQITGLADVEVSAAWIMTDNLILELWHYHHPRTEVGLPPMPDAPGYRHIGFVAESLQAEVERLARAGIALHQDDDVDGVAACRGIDPDGNRFMIMQAPDEEHPLSLVALPDPDAVTRRHRHLLPG